MACLVLLPAAAQDDTEDADKGYLVNLLQDTLSTAGREVQIEGFEGLLSSNASLTRMTIADDDGIWLSLENASLEWNRAALLSGRIEITELSADTLSITRSPKSDDDSLPEAEASGFSLPELPVSINLDALTVDRIVLGASLLGEPAEMRLSASGALAEGSGAIKLDALRLDGKTGQFTVDTAYDAQTEQLKLDLTLQEGDAGLVAQLANLPGAPDLSLSVSGAGPLSDFAADIRLATSDVERMSGRVVLGQTDDTSNFDADLSGDLSSLFWPQYQAFFGTSSELSASGQTLADGSLRLDDFALKTDALDLEGHAALDPSGWPSLLDISGTIGTDDRQNVVLPISGARTEVERLGLDVQFDAENGEAWSGVFELDGLSRPDLALERAEITAQGILQGASGQVGRVRADIDISAAGLSLSDAALSEAAGDNLNGALTVVYAQDAPLELSGLQLDAGDLVVSGDAQIDGLDDGFATTLDLSLIAQDLSRFAALSGQNLQGRASFDLAGDLALGGVFDLQLSGLGDGLAIGQEQADAILAGQTELSFDVARDTSGTVLRQLNLINPQLELDANGDIATGAADLRFDAALNDASLLTPELSGPLTLDGTASQDGALWQVAADAAGPLDATARLEAELEGTRADIAFQARLPDAAEISPQLSGPLELDANASQIESGWQIAADASGPFDATAQITGQIGEATTFEYSAKLPDASALTPELEGPLKLDGRAAQTGTIWTVTAQANGPFDGAADIEAVIDGTQIGVDFEAALPEISRIVPQISGPLRLDGRAEQSNAIWAVTANATGPYDGTADVDAVIDGDEIGVDFAVGLPDISAFAPQYSGALDLEGRAEQRDAIWNVTATANTPYRGTAEVDATIDGADIGVDFSAALPNIAPLVPQFPGAASVTGSARTNGDAWDLSTEAQGPSGLTATVEGQYLTGSSVFDFSANLPNTASFVPEISGPLSVSGAAREAQDGWDLDTSGTGPSGLRFASSGRVRGDGSLDIALDGTAPLGLANPFLSPRSVQGDARFDLVLRGAPELSALSGQIETSGARVSLPTLSAALTDLNTQINVQNGRATLAMDAAMSSGGGVSVQGPVTLSGNYPAELEITLNRFGVTDPQLYKTILDGALRTSGPLLAGARISGQINLGQTDISVPSTGFTSFGEIPEITHIRSPRPVQRSRARAGLGTQAQDSASTSQTGPAYPLDISIDAPSRIFVRGRGLDAELAGGVRVTGTSANPTTAGQFELQRGRLDILGKRFTLDEGSIQLQGSADPTLRFVATTELDDGSASIVIGGQASAPEVSFESVPTAPQDEILARIFFGRDASQLSPFQAIQLASAVATLAGRGGDGVVAKLRQGLDLDDLDVVTNDDGSAELRAGKYLSDNLYTDVTVGTGGTGSVSLNLDISPSVTARGSLGSDGDTSLGVFFERDY